MIHLSTRSEQPDLPITQLLHRMVLDIFQGNTFLNQLNWLLDISNAAKTATLTHVLHTQPATTVTYTFSVSNDRLEVKLNIVRGSHNTYLDFDLELNRDFKKELYTATVPMLQRWLNNE